MKATLVGLIFFALTSCSKENAAVATENSAIANVSEVKSTEEPQTPELDLCMENVDLGAFKNTQWNACYEEELARVDAKLNTAFKALKESLPTPEMRANLTKAQRAWIGFRNEFCQFESSRDMAPSPEINRLSCIVDLTREQANRLQETI